MTEEQKMEINRETAMALWTKRYGKAVRVKDFSGREMDKGSYDNRNSEYGWNLDHILPKSKGGKDTESNLICVHIKTNDEKADKYPVFHANSKTFEIIKVENHYEIHEKKSAKEKLQEYEEKGINFFDHSAAMKFLKRCAEKKYFVGTIYLKIINVKHEGLLLFINEIFSNYGINIEIKHTNDYWSRNKNFEVFAIIEDVDTKEKISNVLDCCVLVNTYLEYYFKKHKLIDSYGISNLLYQFDYPRKLQLEHCVDNRIKYYDNTLVINNLVRINTSAKDENLATYIYNEDLYEYNYYFTRLKDNLEELKK